MRTIIFIGLLSISFSIKSTELGPYTLTFFAIILSFAMVMDIVDFFRSK